MSDLVTEEFDSRVAAEFRLVELRAKDYTIASSDEPERGMKGLVAFKSTNGVEDAVRVCWPIFDGPLETDEAIVTAEELLRFIDPPEQCDDPMARLLGFVRYDPKNGKAIVRRTTLTSLREAPKEVSAKIMAFRASEDTKA